MPLVISKHVAEKKGLFHTSTGLVLRLKRNEQFQKLFASADDAESSVLLQIRWIIPPASMLLRLSPGKTLLHSYAWKERSWRNRSSAPPVLAELSSW
jgi:hypothetical protein